MIKFFAVFLICFISSIHTGYAAGVPSHVGSVGSGIASGFRSDSGCGQIIMVIIGGIIFYAALFFVILAIDTVVKGLKIIFK